MSFLSIISLGLIGGCSDNGGGQNSAQALTENDFSENSDLRADLKEGVIVTFLEAPNSEAPEKDTGEVGIDEIPVIYDETTEQRFCWKDDDVDAMHFMEITDSQDRVILTVEANGDCITQIIEAGNYVISIHHDGSNEDSLPIFLIPNPEELEQARETDGLIDRFKLVASNILKRIERTVSKDAKAQTVIEDIDILLSTKHCDFCSLLNVDLRDADLFGAHLEGADLRGADFSGAILRDVTLSYAGIGTSRHVYAQLVDSATALAIGNIPRPLPPRLDGHAVFHSTIIMESDFVGANLILADFRGADVRLSDFSGADLIGADFRGADLSGTNFGFATWCDGCICAVGSIGGCDGCPPVDICTGL